MMRWLRRIRGSRRSSNRFGLTSSEDPRGTAAYTPNRAPPAAAVRPAFQGRGVGLRRERIMRTAIAASIVLILGTSLLATTDSGPRTRLTDLDLIAALGRPVPAFSGWRRLEAGSQKLRAAGWMDIRVAHDPARGFKYEIV